MNTIINKYRFLLVTGVVVLALLSFSQLSKLTINPGFNDYIPDEIGNRAYMNKLDSIFGGNEKIMLILTTEDDKIINPQCIERIKNLNEELQSLEGIDNSLSLLDVIDIRLEDGITTFEPIVNEISPDPKKLETLKQTILNSKMGQRFVSSDLTATAIILTKSNEIEDQDIITAIKKVIENHPGKEKIYIGGLSYIRQSIKSYISKDLITLLPTALILMILMLYHSFKEWKGVVLPFIVVILSILFSFGFMALLRWEISLISVLLPIMLIAIANDYSIHLINLYQEKSNGGEFSTMKDIALSVYRELRKPILITALTTIGGMLGLLSHKMPPAVELGILTAIGIGLALLMSLFLIPVLLTFYKNTKTIKLQKSQETAIINKTLILFSNWVTIYPKRVVVAFIAMALVSFAGIFFLKVDTNIEGYFLGKSDIKQGIELVNSKFGGSQYVSVLFNGDVLSPEALDRMDIYTKRISKLPQVGHVISPTLFLQELSKGMYMPDQPGYQALPKTKEEAVQYLEFIEMSGFDGQKAQLIDYNYNNARILVSMKDGSNQTGKALLKALKEITKGDPQLVCIAGPGLSKIQIAEMVVSGQITSLILALLIIIILLSIMFKSFIAAVHGCLPLVFSALILFGLMGFLGISLDIVTALLSSIMIGVGVDYTIHFLWRYKAEYAKTGDSKSAISNTFTTTGRGIVFNAFSVIVGFSVLIFSSFAPLRFFGVLVVASIFSCLISALLLIPAIISITQPRFLEPLLSSKVYDLSQKETVKTLVG